MITFEEIANRALESACTFLEPKTWFHKVDVSGDIVENHTNNANQGGELCRIGDKLYFDYAKSTMHSGIIEISKNGSRRIYWKGPEPGWYRVGPIYGFPTEDVLYFFYDAGDGFLKILIEIDLKTRIVKKSKRFLKGGKSSNWVAYSDGKYYCTKPKDLLNPSRTGEFAVVVEPVGKRKDKIKKFLPINNVTVFYPYKGKIYYVKTDTSTYEGDKNGKPNITEKIYVYDETTEETKEFLPFVGNLVIDNDYMIIRKENEDGTTSLCKYKLDQTEEIKEIKNMGKVPFCLNACNGKVYTSSIGGVKEIDLETLEEKTLTKHQALGSCYIVDNKWVYFVNEKELWRVSQDGKTTEKVFG